MKVNKVLFVDDDEDVRLAYGQSLTLAGFDTTLCSFFIEATDHITPGWTGVVVTDVRMPGKDGFDLLGRSKQIDPDLPVIVLTGEGDIPMAVRAISDGAYDFLEKPCPPRKLIASVERALDKRRLVLENRRLLVERNAIDHARTTGPEAGLTAQLAMVERLLIEASLRDHKGKVTAVSEALKLPRKTLYDKLSRYGIEPAEFR
jgi:two-component system C4-dicarboxylate transport response regulator DctD